MGGGGFVGMCVRPQPSTAVPSFPTPTPSHTTALPHAYPGSLRAGTLVNTKRVNVVEGLAGKERVRLGTPTRNTHTWGPPEPVTHDP